MSQGNLVPDRVVLGLVQERLENLPDDSQGWILDGFPRNESQARSLDAILAAIAQESYRTLNLDVPDEILIDRLLKRGRQDDSESVVRHRLQVYRDQTAPLIDFYQSRQNLISIDGNAEVTQVTDRIHQAVTQAPAP